VTGVPGCLLDHLQGDPAKVGDLTRVVALVVPRGGGRQRCRDQDRVGSRALVLVERDDGGGRMVGRERRIPASRN
jgi:hypothetical protein